MEGASLDDGEDKAREWTLAERALVEPCITLVQVGCFHAHTIVHKNPIRNSFSRLHPPPLLPGLNFPYAHIHTSYQLTSLGQFLGSLSVTVVYNSCSSFKS